MTGGQQVTRAAHRLEQAAASRRSCAPGRLLQPRVEAEIAFVLGTDLGEPLRAGQGVLSGAMGPMVPVQPGTRVRAELNDVAVEHSAT